MTPAQFRKKYNLTTQSVYRWIREGKIPHKKLITSVERIVIDDDAVPPASLKEWKTIRGLE